MDNNKPIAPLIGANGNIFNLLSIARNSLISNNKPNDAREMWDRVTNSKSYNEALRIIEDYVEFGEADGQDVSDHTWTYELEEQRQREIVRTNNTKEISGKETKRIGVKTIGKVGSAETGGSEDIEGNEGIGDTNSTEHYNQEEFKGEDAVVIYGLNTNPNITKVDFTQELHITNNDIDEIMKRFIEESTINWYESISSSPTIQEDVKSNLISSGGTIFFRLQGENRQRTFDKHDLIYGLLRVLPDCLYVINGIQIDTLLLDYDNIDHIVQYGLFGRIRFDDEQMESRAEDNE